ncbi:MAG: nitroreductase family protein [Candidatus Marinimicrobia bacterium]|nr:nitroreductase family protein [Candidatus Neomarinimicrobiota bacterium]
MIFQQSSVDLIKARSSWRNYSERPLEPEVRGKIEHFLAQSPKGIFGTEPHFYLIEKTSEDEKIKLGTYGLIRGAQTFVVGTISVTDPGYVDFGYLMERIVLFLTDLNLGTCWLGGTLNRGEFAKALNLPDSQMIPAITPVGYTDSDRTLREKIIRFGAGSRSRKGWKELFFDGNIHKSLDEEVAEKYSLPLEMVRWAPSASNKQPWRVIKETGQPHYHFYLKRTPGYIKPERQIDLQKVDLGIAMFHFETVAQEIKLRGKWENRQLENLFERDAEYIVSWIGE